MVLSRRQSTQWPLQNILYAKMLDFLAVLGFAKTSEEISTSSSLSRLQVHMVF